MATTMTAVRQIRVLSARAGDAAVGRVWEKDGTYRDLPRGGRQKSGLPETSPSQSLSPVAMLAEFRWLIS